MRNLAPELDSIVEQLGRLGAPDEVSGLADDELLMSTGALERLARWVGALQVAVAAEVDHRSRHELGTDGLAATKGCRTSTELLERITLASSETLSKRLKVGRNTRTRCSLVGEQMPASFPHVAEALASGSLGLDSAYLIVRGLASVAPVVDALSIETAEFELVAAATGTAPESPYPCTADDTKIHTEVWKARLDQDGRLPIEERALRMRSFTIGREQNGLVPVRGALIPDVAAKFTALVNAYTSPRTAPAFLDAEELAAHDLERDPRTREQQCHDIFAGIVDTAARSAQTPSMGGAAPAVMVSVRLSDLDAGIDNNRGVGHIDGLDTPVSMRVVKQYTCNGGIQRVVFDDYGRIINMGSTERCFTPQQRRAIALRDGECSVPGCHIPAAWSEIHHVDPAENGGPTHTDNGILLCWFHHRTLDTSGWQFRMINGAPHVKAPPWLDTTQKWRPTTGSRIRQMDAVDKVPILVGDRQ